jgi:two-component system, chemotaxis family, chemotaxis protein CheY
MRALVIDDSVAMRMYVAAMLENQGIDTAMACDGQDALGKLDEPSPAFDFATVDRDMPVMDGPTFVTKVRLHPRHRHMKLVMVTAREGLDAVIQALATGADDYLMKPVTEDMLAEKLRVMGLLK